MFCKHKWDLLSEKTTESKLELLQRITSLEITECKESLLERKFIQLLKCDKCGKFKKLVTSI